MSMASWKVWYLGNKDCEKVSNKKRKEKVPDRNIKGSALGAEDVGFLQVDFFDEAAGDVPFGIYVHKIS